MLVLALSSLALSAPSFRYRGQPIADLSKRQDNSLYEDIPWQVTDLTVFTPATKSSYEPQISFNIVDLNPGLQFNKTCFRKGTAAGNETTVVSDQYFGCNGDGDFLEYEYNGVEMTIERFWKTPG